MFLARLAADPFEVRMKGLEPPRPKALDPKSSASTNSATSAEFPPQIYCFLTRKSKDVGWALIRWL